MSKNIFFTAVLIITIIGAAACSKKNNNISGYVDKTFFEMGTIVNLTIEARHAKYIPDIIKIMRNTTQAIVDDENKINNAKPGEIVKVSDDFVYLYNKSIEYYNNSNKLYDPTVYTTASLYGFPDKGFKIPDNNSLNTAKKNAGFTNTELKGNKFIKKTNLLINMSANSKGYIVDKTTKFMKRKGMKNFIVNAGGDLYIDGVKSENNPFRVYIQNPDKENGISSIIHFSNKALATSGNYERFFMDGDRRITHIFEGVSFDSTNNYKSISVIADTTEKADALATMFFLLDVPAIKQKCMEYNTPVLVITLDNRKYKFCNWISYETN